MLLDVCQVLLCALVRFAAAALAGLVKIQELAVPSLCDVFCVTTKMLQFKKTVVETATF